MVTFPDVKSMFVLIFHHNILVSEFVFPHCREHLKDARLISLTPEYFQDQQNIWVFILRIHMMTFEAPLNSVFIYVCRRFIIKNLDLLLYGPVPSPLTLKHQFFLFIPNALPHLFVLDLKILFFHLTKFYSNNLQ